MTQKERERLKYQKLWEQFQRQLANERKIAGHALTTIEQRKRQREAKQLIRKIKSICVRQRRRALKLLTPLVLFTMQDWEECKARYSYQCAYCRQLKPLTQDHVIPLSRGGYHHKSNIIPACKSCNSRKGNRPADRFNPLLLPW